MTVLQPQDDLLEELNLVSAQEELYLGVGAIMPNDISIATINEVATLSALSER